MNLDLFRDRWRGGRDWKYIYIYVQVYIYTIRGSKLRSRVIPDNKFSNVTMK